MDLNKPVNFIKGTPEIADDVNSDFDTLYNFLNSTIIKGVGSPNNVVNANISTLYLDTTPGSGLVYRKIIDGGSTGWLPINSVGSYLVDETNIADGRVLGYSSSENKIVYTQVATNAQLISEASTRASADTTLQNNINNTVPLSYLSIDGTFLADSDSLIPTQKAVKTYVDTETSRAEGIEAYLQGLINQESTRATNTENSLLSSISQMIYTTTTQVSNYYEIITSGKRIILCDASSGSLNVTLPSAIGNKAEIIVKKIDNTSNTVTVLAPNPQNIDGQTSQILTTQYSRFDLISDNINWWLI